MGLKEEKVLKETDFWEHLTLKEKELVLSQSSLREFEADQVISSSDTSCTGIVFVKSGGIRACIISDEGREITLYRLGPGDCCVTTASCVIRQITFDTVVSASGKTQLFIIPAAVVSGLLKTNIYFRAFLYEKETERFSQAIWAMQELLFKRFDQRLAGYLMEKYRETGKADLKLTQEEIARDVNSAREVVARMLKHFSEEGLLEVKRGQVKILDIEGLEEIL